MLLTTKLEGFNDLLETVKELGGATIYKCNEKSFFLHEYESGYQVAFDAMHGGQEFKFNLKTELPYFIDRLLSMPNKQTFGLWINNDTLYLDYITEHYDNLDCALEVAKENNQKAIYDWTTGESIYLNTLESNAKELLPKLGDKKVVIMTMFGDIVSDTSDILYGKENEMPTIQEVFEDEYWKKQIIKYCSITYISVIIIIE